MMWLTSWCGWHDDWDDDVVAMIVRQLAIDNRLQLGSFPSKLPLIRNYEHHELYINSGLQVFGAGCCCEATPISREHNARRCYIVSWHHNKDCQTILSPNAWFVCPVPLSSSLVAFTVSFWEWSKCANPSFREKLLLWSLLHCQTKSLFEARNCKLCTCLFHSWNSSPPSNCPGVLLPLQERHASPSPHPADGKVTTSARGLPQLGPEQHLRLQEHLTPKKPLKRKPN